jgi:tetratricopeptide (TPR) repeat protein
MRRPALALVAITILAYLPVLRAGFIWDDDSYVEHNASLRSLDGLWRIWTDTDATPQYYPLVHTTFWVEQHLWGTASAIPFHVLNLLLHATAAVLLRRLLTRLLPLAPGFARVSPEPRQSRGLMEGSPTATAWLAAALWAVHPLQVESVAWVTERKNVLSAVFYLLAFAVYLNAVVDPKNPRMYIRGSVALDPLRYAAAFGLFLLALFSKTVTATLPAAVLLVLWWKRGRITLRDVYPLIPFFLAGALLGLNTGHLENVHVGAHGPEFAFTPIDRILIAGRAVCFYAAKLAVPYPLSFIYPRWTIDRHAAWQYLFPAAVVAVLAALWLLRRPLGRGPLVAALFFVGTLFPALGFANVYPMRYAFVADHFQYLACIGPITLFASVLPLAASQTRWLTPIATLLVSACVALTFTRALAYRDRYRLWSDTVAKNPDSWMAHTNLGHALVDADRIDAAWAQYQIAARLAPHLPEPHFNLAMGHARVGDYAAAAAECRLAIAADPGYAPAYANLAKILVHQNQLPAAVDAGRTATRLAPGYPMGHYALGQALDRSGLTPEAAAEYGLAVGLNPDDADAQSHLADALNRLGQFPRAVEHYEAAVSINPGDPAVWTNLGYALLHVGRSADAATSFRRALAIDPTFAPAARGLHATAPQL